jgi:hypothetical protein
MGSLKISDTGDYFIRGGKGFFYLADTVWSAFTNVSVREWEEYLDYRRKQNFNVLQINILPQWDRSVADRGIYPFETAKDGRFDFYRLNEAYFERAGELLGRAVEKGFVPALVVLWCDYVKDTWASARMPDHIMPPDAVKPYVEYAVRAFSRYDPIYLISGDTDFGTGDTSDYYRLALETVKAECPEALAAMHLAGGLTELPEEFVNSPDLDFYMYQSGHRLEEQHFTYTMAKAFCGKPVKRPVVNGEPCYEGSGYGNRYGRFGEADVRKAVWQSLLSGAKAGIAYGAHGIWSWHDKNKSFPSEDFSSGPYRWREALRFRGAWDASFARYLFEQYDLFGLVPRDLIRNRTEEIRCAGTADGKKLVFYAPCSADLEVEADLSGYELVQINLRDRTFAKPATEVNAGRTVIKMEEPDSDMLVIGREL